MSVVITALSVILFGMIRPSLHAQGGNESVASEARFRGDVVQA